jgi:predicted HicB family RNase H-like nuclease
LRQIIPTTDLIDVIQDVECGQPLTVAVKNSGITLNQFFVAIKEHPGLAELYQEAVKNRAEVYVAETITIADTDPDPQSARVRISARQWAASRENPDKYSEKLNVEVTHKIDLRAAMEAARNRIVGLQAGEIKHEIQPLTIPVEARTVEPVPDEKSEEEAEPLVNMIDENDPFS